MTESLTGSSVLDLTAMIVANHVANNAVHAAELPKMIATVHAALAGLGAPEPAAVGEPEHQPAVSVRKSLASDEHIISMIDGKPYRVLRRHLRTQGLTDKDYRTRYKLPADYPMVARSYSAARTALAKQIKLSQKAGGKVAAAAEVAESKVEETAAPVVEQAKRDGRKAAAVEGAVKPTAKRSKHDPQAE